MAEIFNRLVMVIRLNTSSVALTHHTQPMVNIVATNSNCQWTELLLTVTAYSGHCSLSVLVAGNILEKDNPSRLLSSHVEW